MRRSHERECAMGFLKFTHALARLANAVQNFISQHRFRILNFVRCVHYAHIAQNFASQCEFKILKFIHEPPHALRHALTRAPRRILPRTDKAEVGRAASLTSRYTYDATEKRCAVRFNHAGGYSNFVRRRIVRLRSAATRRSYKTARAEKLSKFDLTGALLNFKSRFAMQLCSAVTRRNYEAWRSEIYAVCLHKYPALIRAASGKISRYEVGQATNASLLRGVQRMKFCAQKRLAMKFLKFLGASRFGSQTAVGRGFEILKFSAAERLKRRFEPQKQAAELLNSSSLPPRKFKLALLKFSPAPSRNGFEILKFVPELNDGSEILKFTPAPHKFKPTSIPFLNFISNFTPHASASKFENGVKFKGAAKFKRGAR